MAGLNTKTELITAPDDSIHQPILGKVTVREMLCFTIYHNLWHVSQEGD